MLVSSVDIVLGPLLTFAVFNVKKGWPHLRRDLAAIGAIQFAALIYGLWTVCSARPVALVFETDRFRVVSAAQVKLDELPLALPEYRRLPLTGPWLLGARAAHAGQERDDALFLSLDGIDRAERPLFWRPYEDLRGAALTRSRPLRLLLERYPSYVDSLRESLRERKVEEAGATFLPITGRGGDWVVVLDNQGQLVSYVPVDGFF